MRSLFSGRSLLVVGALTVSVSCPLADAATKYVNVNLTTGLNNGTTWPNAFTSLHDGIAAAVAGDEVWVAAGTYKPHVSNTGISFALKAQVKVFGGFAGTESSLSQRDPVANVTILSGDLDGNDTPDFLNHANNSQHVVRAASGVTAIGTGPITERINLDGFTVKSGNGGNGGGIYITDSSPVIRNCKITLCKAVAGGGIYADDDDDTHAVIRNCEVTGNLATDNVSGTGGGGGMRVYGPCAILNCTIADNVSEGYGGGLRTFSANNTHVRIVSSSILENESLIGGGLSAAGGSTSGSRLSLVNCVIAKNEATDSALGEGGGLHTGEVSVTLDNCTVADNDAYVTGGGWYFYRGSADAPIMRNSIFWGNAASAGPQYYAETGGHTSLNCTLGPGSTGQPADTVINSSGADPMFVHPPSGNYQLMCGIPNSPCINSGDTALARVDTDDVDEDSNTTELAVDRAMSFRAVNAVDRGAYETPVGSGCQPSDIFPAPCGNGKTDIDDLLVVIGTWGACPADAPCMGNVPGTGYTVDIDDLLDVIGEWGDCVTGPTQMPTSINDCMEQVSERYEAFSPEWQSAFEACCDYLCITEQIECD